jgi:lysophospholipase L1-like esterase
VDLSMPKLVCFGDSLTARNEGYHTPMLTTKLSKQLPNYEIINAGVAGHTTKDAMKRIQKDVLTYHPEIVTVMFGSNDAATHKKVSIKTYEDNLFEIIRLIGAKKTILITPPPVDESLQPNRRNDEIAKYADVVTKIANETGSYDIDFFTEMVSIPDYEQKLVGILNDGLHFGEEGYDILVSLITKKVNNLNRNI